MSARGEVGCEVVSQTRDHVIAHYVSARTPAWLLALAERRGWRWMLDGAIGAAHQRAHGGDLDAARRWAAVADALARALAAEATDGEVWS